MVVMKNVLQRDGQVIISYVLSLLAWVNEKLQEYVFLRFYHSLRSGIGARKIQRFWMVISKMINNNFIGIGVLSGMIMENMIRFLYVYRFMKVSGEVL